MTEEIKLDGLGLAPGVLETIVTIATEQVPGVAGVCAPGLAAMVGKAKGARLVEVTVDEDNVVTVALHIQAEYGKPLRAVAKGVQAAVADAIKSQFGAAVGTVDVYVDGIVFEG